MKFSEIRKDLEESAVISIVDLRLLDRSFSRSKVSSWIKAGHIIPIIRGFYLFGETERNQNLSYRISNRIYQPSYVSLESAFSYYGLIPEGVFLVTSVSTKKTAKFSTDVWYFLYRQIRTTLYWGYRVVTIGKTPFFMAEIEKAVLDYLYLNHRIVSYEDFEGLRINREVFLEKADTEKFMRYAKMFQSPTVMAKAKEFLHYVNH